MGASFAIVTHDESLAADCDKIVYLRDGVVDHIEQRNQSLNGKESDI